jgi:hypothetical protein
MIMHVILFFESVNCTAYDDTKFLFDNRREIERNIVNRQCSLLANVTADTVKTCYFK